MLPNSAFDRTAGSHSLAAAGQRDRWASKTHREYHMPTDPSDSNPLQNIEAAQRYHAAVHEKLDGFNAPFVVVAATGAIALAVQLILYYCSRVHWVLAASVSIAVVLVCIWVTRLARRPLLASTRAMGAASLSVGLWAAVTLAGWASMTLHSLGIGTYVATSAPSLDVFTRLYFYTLADMIPAIKITETLHLKPPLQTQDFAAGVPVLLFRVFVLWFLFDAFKTWRKSRKDAGKEKSSDILVFAILVLLFVVTVLVDLR